jgi:hypothetical protein
MDPMEQTPDAFTIQQALMEFQRTRGRPPSADELRRFHEAWARTPQEGRDLRFACYLLEKTSAGGASSGMSAAPGYGKEKPHAWWRNPYMAVLLVAAPAIFWMGAMAWDWFSFTQLQPYFQKSSGGRIWTAAEGHMRIKANIFGGDNDAGYFAKRTSGPMKGFFVVTVICSLLGLYLLFVDMGSGGGGGSGSGLDGDGMSDI